MSVAAATLSTPLERRSPWPSQWSLLVLPALALVVLFLAVPYLNIVVMSFRTPSTTAPYAPGFTLTNYVKALSDSFYLAVLVRTLYISVLVTVVCLLISFPVAYHLSRTQSRMRGLLFACILSPLLVSAVIRCYGWIIILSNNGVINASLKQWDLIERPVPLMYNELGVVIGLVHIYMPFMVLPLLGAMQSINPSLEEAAQSLGARRLTVMRRVVVPLAMPGVQSGATLVFILAASAYVTPVVLGGSRVKLMTPMVVQQLAETFLWPFGAALAIVLAVIGALAVLAWARATQRLMKGEA